MAQPVSFKLPSDKNKMLTANPMNIGQINQLMSPKNKGMKGMNLLMKHIIPTCAGIDPGDYETSLAGDGAAILLALRRSTFGEELDYRASCPACQKAGEFYVQLDQLEIKYLEVNEETGVAKTTGFELKYDHNGTPLTYQYHLPTVADQVSAQKNQEKLESENPDLDFSLVATISAIIDEISPLTQGMGEKEKEMKILEHVFYLPLDFLDMLKNEREEVDCGFDSVIDQTCQQCGQVFATELPLLESFFSPDPRTLKKQRLLRAEKKKKESPFALESGTPSTMPLSTS